MSKKRFLSIVLSAVMILSLACSALAVGQSGRYIGNSTVNGSIYQTYYQVDAQTRTGIAADSSSHQLATKTASAVGEVSYCYASTGNSAGLSSSVDMDTSQSGGVVGTPVIINHQNTSTYGKHISGTVGVGTQSNSSNMETIQIFVAYAHSTVSVTFSADVALQWKQVGMSINFTPQKKTTIIARGNATFKYNGQGYQTAGTV